MPGLWWFFAGIGRLAKIGKPICYGLPWNPVPATLPEQINSSPRARVRVGGQVVRNLTTRSPACVWVVYSTLAQCCARVAGTLVVRYFWQGCHFYQSRSNRMCRDSGGSLPVLARLPFSVNSTNQSDIVCCGTPILSAISSWVCPVCGGCRTTQGNAESEPHCN